ncbi:MAG: primosomal protein N' [Candidatus Rifleibacteriota bacterium]
MIYVEVSFSEPIGDGTLTYHLNENVPVPAIGCRVVVPVQGRRLIGYITSIHTTPPEFKTLALGEIIDPLPLFSDAMIRLAEIVAEECVCNIGEVLHAMLPGGIRQKIVRHVKISENSEVPGDIHPALSWLKTQGWTNLISLQDKFPDTGNKISGWLKNGLIQISHSVSKCAGPKIIRVLKPAPDKPIEVEKLTPKEKQTMQTLMKLSNAPTAAMLCRLAQVSSGPVNQLKKKGLIIEVEERIMRQVATGKYYQCPSENPPELTDEQRKVLETIKRAYVGDMKPVLVRGVTCSGKTEVYLRWVSEILKEKKGAIILVPEISLTPQMMKRFKDRFGNKVAILHSKLSTGERFDQWESIRLGECPVVVGARSAVFAPVPNLGTIILDEEGEPSFKQGDSPRYHAREVARHRCRLENALLVMGSATPTIDSFKLCHDNAFHLVEMNTRVSNRLPPQVKVVDMRYELVAKKNRSIFSNDLTAAIDETLKSKKQAILYLNRRGFSSFIFCRECGEAIECSQCKVSLVYHTGSQILRCHYCGEIREIPKICPSCQSQAIKFFGAGTQRVEAEVKRYFPQARVARIDSDTVSTKGSLESLLDQFGKGKIDILIGTQMVAKGLDFPNVTLVGILAADSLLRIPDFRASERNFSLLAQVSGRAGRGDTPGKVILQTYYPDHHSIRYALTENYHGFYAEESSLRKEALFPPYIELASYIISSSDKEKAQLTAATIAENLLKSEDVSAEMLFGPAPASIERLHGRYRFQILLKMPSLKALTNNVKASITGVKKPGDTRIIVDINPFFMI